MQASVWGVVLGLGILVVAVAVGLPLIFWLALKLAPAQLKFGHWFSGKAIRNSVPGARRSDADGMVLASANPVRSDRSALGGLRVERFAITASGLVGPKNQGILVEKLTAHVLSWCAEQGVQPLNVDLAVSAHDAQALVLVDPRRRGPIAAQVFRESIVGLLGAQARQRALGKALARADAWSASRAGCAPCYTSTGLSRAGAFLVVWYVPARTRLQAPQLSSR